MEECVAGADVREEGVSQSLAVACSLNQTRDVHDVQVRGLLADRNRLLIRDRLSFLSLIVSPNTCLLTAEKSR